MKRALGFMNKALPISYNTYIGGISATVGTDALLATKLGISVGAISNFTVVGSDIKCKITGSYTLASANFYNDSSLIYFYDYDGLITSLSDNTFSNCPQLRVLLLKGLLSIGNNTFANNNTNLPLTIYIPNCVTLGSNTIDNGNFYLLSGGANTIIYAHPSMQTINSGGVEPDLDYAINTRLNTVRYVANFTLPSQITDLSSGTIFNEAIKLNFTQPTGNAIDYYECYLNGVFKTKIASSGEFLTELSKNTSYNITIIAVDIYFNKSIVSNILSATTANNSIDITDNLLNYYKLDETSGSIAVDSYGQKHLINTSISVNQIGKIGTGYKFNGAGFLKSKPYNYLTMKRTSFTLSFWFKMPTVASSVFFSSWGNPSSILIRLSGGNIQFYTFTASQVGGTILSFSDTTNWHHLAFTYNGTTMKAYLDGVVSATTYAQTGAIRLGGIEERFGEDRGQYSTLHMDEIASHSTALTQTQIDYLYNSGTGVTL